MNVFLAIGFFEVVNYRLPVRVQSSVDAHIYI